MSKVSPTCARTADIEILGFMRVSGDDIEMLFIDPDFMGKGIGKILLLHAINNLNVKKVDVNEQNEKA